MVHQSHSPERDDYNVIHPTSRRTPSMVGRNPRKNKRPKLMGNHNRCWLWGRHVVTETLAAGRWPMVELLLADDVDEAERQSITSLAAERSIPVETAPARRLSQLCGATDHQGLLAKMRPFPFLTVDALLVDLQTDAVLCLLDGIQDPHNYGAILRSAEVLGINGVIVGSTRQSDVSAIVARSSAGAVNHLPLAQTDDVVATAGRLREQHGFCAVAADHHAQTMPADRDWTGPTLLVIGNEAVGVSPELLAACDCGVCIPQIGRTESLNAAVAAGILFYEVRRQRSGDRFT